MSGNIFVKNFEKLASYDETQNITLAPVFVWKTHMVLTGHRISSVASEM